MAELTKMMIVNLLGRRFACKSYVELATPSTGRMFSQVDRDGFDQVARMMYLTPIIFFDDGMQIDFRSPDEDISGILAEFRASGRRVDISLVDGWHTYKTARRDLAEMFDLLSDGGVLVVHDCLPAAREGASPRFRPGNWWGQSYKAFLDFVLENPALDYFTLDCDHGCGVILKHRLADAMLGQDVPSGWLPPRPGGELVKDWFASGGDADQAFDVFSARHRELLRLLPAERFMAFFSAAELEGSRKAMTPPSAPPLAPARPQRPSLSSWLLRALNRKLVAMTGQKVIAPPPRERPVPRDRDAP